MSAIGTMIDDLEEDRRKWVQRALYYKEALEDIVHSIETMNLNHMPNYVESMIRDKATAALAFMEAEDGNLATEP